MKSLFWADQIADEISRRDKKVYVCAAGITPSGIVHIGNFREIITVDLVVKALESRGKKVRFIYSWDDYDRMRKVPAGVPATWKKYIGMPLSGVPDPWKCHSSYARHFEEEVEKAVAKMWVKPEFIRQSNMYKKCVYAKLVKLAIDKKAEIKRILDGYRKEPLNKNWYPVIIYCEKCGRDSTKILSVDGYKLVYKCSCGHENEIDFRKKGIVKLKWRADWPMRWAFEKVDFEPGGKEHSTPGGSRTTAAIIVKRVFDYPPPVYKMYDFITLKGVGGKMSSSKGNVIRIPDVLEVYDPAVLRHIFTRSKPNKEFAISFDEDVLTNYEEFDYYERVYYGKGKEINKKKKMQISRIYELSQVDHPKTMPVQIPFGQLITISQIFSEKELESYFKVKTKFDKKRLKTRLSCVKNWLEKYAPGKYKFELQEKPKKVPAYLAPAVKDLVRALSRRQSENELYLEFFNICKSRGVPTKDFFKAVYKALIDKDYGPRLAPFIFAIGKKKVAGILKKAV